jgi:hypothetical protein
LWWVLAQDLLQMGLVPDEGAVQEFASASPDPAFGDRIHAWRLDVAEHGPVPPEYSIEQHSPSQPSPR